MGDFSFKLLTLSGFYAIVYKGVATNVFAGGFMKDGIGVRGRHGKQVYIDGEFYELRGLIKVGASSKGICLPSIWLNYVGANAEIKGIGVKVDGDILILKPYFGDDGTTAQGEE